MENEISDLKQTITELKTEVISSKERNSLTSYSIDQPGIDVKKLLRDEWMKQVENMVKDSKTRQKVDLIDWISLLEANPGLLNNDRKTFISQNIKTLIDNLIPDFVKRVFLRSEDLIDQGKIQFLTI